MTMRHKLCAFLLFAMSGLQVATPQMRFGGPVSGVFFDAARGEVRPILGVPGAAYQGEPYLSGIQKACVAPNSASAAVSKDGALYLVSNLAEQPDWLSLQAAPENILLAWAPDSSAFAAYSPEVGEFNVYNADGTPVGVALDLGGIAGRVSIVALTTARRAIAVAEDADGAAAYLLVAGEPASLLARASSARLIAVGEDGRSLLAAKPESGELVEVRDIAGSPTALTHALPGELGQELAGVVLSSRTRTAYFSSANPEPALISFDLAAGEISQKAMLDSVATGLEWLENGRRLLLLDAQGSVSLVDPALATRAYFVPSGPATEQ